MKQVDTIVLVKNIKEIDIFYRNILGLEILHDWGDMLIYKNRLALHQVDKLQPEEFARSMDSINSINNRVIIYLELEKGYVLEDILIKLKDKKVNIIHGVYQLPWQRIIRIYDPENNIIEIGEPVK